VGLYSFELSEDILRGDMGMGGHTFLIAHTTAASVGVFLVDQDFKFAIARLYKTGGLGSE